MTGMRLVAGLCCLAVALLTAGTVQAITLDTVTVGNPGNAADTAAHSGNPAGQGAVAYSYDIGKYEVTAGQYTAFLNAVAATDAYALYNASMWSSTYGCKIQRSGTSGSYTYSVPTDYANRPVNNVSWGDAARFANWLTNGQPTGAQGFSTTENGSYCLNGATSDAALLAVTRKANWKWAITSEDEWYKAAYHDKTAGLAATYFDYPTGTNTAPGQDMADASGNNANYYTGSGAYPIDSGKYTTVAGEFQNSASPYGTFDQGGNVFEWNEAILSGSYRGLRGGSFHGLYGNVLQAADRSDYYPAYEGDGIGFRVSQVPEPASMALLAVGGIGVLVRRWFDSAHRRRGLRG